MTRTAVFPAVFTMAALGAGVGLAVVPQQHRLFATVPRLAPIAVGLNGSAIYIASAVGAGLGGVVLATGGPGAPTIVAALVGAIAVLAGIFVVPERVGATTGAVDVPYDRPDNKTRRSRLRACCTGWHEGT